MIALRPRDQHVWDPRPFPHETEAETKTNYCETETETKKVVSRPRWSRDLNIPDKEMQEEENTGLINY